MLLFHRRTKKAIKLVWGVISVLIVLSMVVTYSGFTMLARTAVPATDPTADAAQLNTQNQATQDRVDVPNASSTITLDPTPAPTPSAPPVEKLDFSL